MRFLEERGCDGDSNSSPAAIDSPFIISAQMQSAPEFGLTDIGTLFGRCSASAPGEYSRRTQVSGKYPDRLGASFRGCAEGPDLGGSRYALRSADRELEGMN